VVSHGPTATGRPLRVQNGCSWSSPAGRAFVRVQLSASLIFAAAIYPSPWLRAT
jgi:hypothetical protein